VADGRGVTAAPVAVVAVPQAAAVRLTSEITVNRDAMVVRVASADLFCVII
jgi:hypothetical protein